jgi:hypothetical protein
MRSSRSHSARKELFQRGIQRGRLTVQEIERALPAGTLSDAERWLLYYSLRAAGVEIRDERTHADAGPGLGEDQQLPPE